MKQEWVHLFREEMGAFVKKFPTDERVKGLEWALSEIDPIVDEAEHYSGRPMIAMVDTSRAIETCLVATLQTMIVHLHGTGGAPRSMAEIEGFVACTSAALQELRHCLVTEIG